MPGWFFNRLVPLFGGVLRNEPEVLLETHVPKPGRIKHHYTISGIVIILFIEVNLALLNHYQGKLSQYARVIAESISMLSIEIVVHALTYIVACSFVNSENGFRLPVMGILSDAENFQFFKFDETELPHFALGSFDDGRDTLNISRDSYSGYDVQTAVLQFRQICESLYCIFLLAYQHGVTANWKQSVVESEHQVNESSISDWKNAVDLADKALDQAKTAFAQHLQGLPESQDTAKVAIQHLAERYDIAHSLIY